MSATPTSACTIRRAASSDLAAAVGAVRELLVELGGEAPRADAMEEATRELIEDPDAGLVLLAEIDGALVGVLAASWVIAIHTCGRYALLQDLWVRSAHRSDGVGARLIDALCAESRERGMPRVEVGLPSESFPRLQATRAFYARNGFRPLGPRMRLMLT